jgi:hypothetical protein
MPVSAAKDPQKAIGRAPERLTLDERHALTGKYVALEIYSPDTLPFRLIEAIGNSVEDCIRQLSARRLDALRFEFVRLAPPY